MRQLLEKETSEEEIQKEERTITHSDYDSISELEGHESEEESDVDEIENEGDAYFIGRDKTKRWNKQPLVSKFAKTKKIH